MAAAPGKLHIKKTLLLGNNSSTSGNISVMANRETQQKKARLIKKPLNLEALQIQTYGPPGEIQEVTASREQTDNNVANSITEQ